MVREESHVSVGKDLEVESRQTEMRQDEEDRDENWEQRKNLKQQPL
jgi:hypothetical protein